MHACMYAGDGVGGKEHSPNRDGCSSSRVRRRFEMGIGAEVTMPIHVPNEFAVE